MTKKPIEDMWIDKINKIRKMLDDIQQQLKDLDYSMKVQHDSGKMIIIEGKGQIPLFRRDLKESATLISMVNDKVVWIQQNIV